MHHFDLPLIAVIMLILGAPPFMALAGSEGLYVQMALIATWALAIGTLLMMTTRSRKTR